MNRNNRFIRTLIAAKRAFLTGAMPPAPKQAPEKKAAPKAPPAKKVSKSADTPQNLTPHYILSKDPKTINDLLHSYCIGCSACASVCPVDAITLRPDEQGFFSAKLNTDKCVNCGKCAKVCPVINTKHNNDENPDCYAVMANDEIRTESSSGGTFSLIANYILDNGGYVCGAAFLDDFTVKHIIISSKDELYRLRGSKYVQSNMDGVFREIKKLLTDGKTVLFSGCPCQVAGLNAYLEKDYDNLYTLDLVCHGAPPQKAFLKYIDEYYGRENLENFKFRTKEYGYNSFNQIAYLKDGTKIGGNIRFDPYEKAMHSGLALKDVCADCMFAPAPRQGDISTGDFWGIPKYDPGLNDNLGTSVTLINNKKGKTLFESVKETAKLYKPVPYSFARANNRFGRKMRFPSNGRKWFYQMLEGQSFGKSVDYALKRRFDVGVIGLWYGRNYGSMATYYALHQVLTNKYHLSVLMIENPLAPNKYEVTRSHPRGVAEVFYDVSRKYQLDELGQLNKFCDAFVVGSDQLWNVGLSRPYKQMYYLDFVNDVNKRIAYGTSFGKKYKGTREELIISSNNLRKFDYVSVRDKLSLKIATEQFGVKNVVDVCDPTFLCSLEEYQKLIDLAENKQEGKYILAYFLDPNPEIGEQLRKIAAEKDCKIVVVLDEPPWTWEKNSAALEISVDDRIEIKREVTLYEWMWLYSHSKAVLTDSFHGTIFSLIFQKPFMTLINNKRGGERFISLLTPLNLTGRLYEVPSDFTLHNDMLDGLDYTEPAKKLDEIREKSMKWLENALFGKKTVDCDRIYPLIDKEFDK